MVVEVIAESDPDEQKTQGNHREDPNQCEHERDSVQVALGSRRTKRRATSTSEHVGKTAATSTVEQNSADQGKHGHHIDDQHDVKHHVTHGERSYRASLLSGGKIITVEDIQQVTGSSRRPTHNEAVIELECAIGDRKDRKIVCRHQRCDSALGDHPTDQHHDLSAGA